MPSANANAFCTLKDAYRRLGLMDPLQWEIEQTRRNLQGGLPDIRRGTGITTRLLIEAILDTMRGKSVLFLGPTRAAGVDILTQALKIRSALGTTPNSARDLFHYKSIRDQIPGHTTDVVYLDHYTGRGSDCRPLPGPYGHIRTFNQSPKNHKHWEARNYDGELLLSLDQKTAWGLKERFPERIRILAPVASEYVKACSDQHVHIANHMVLGDLQQIFDGVRVSAGDQVLLLQQHESSENSVYEVFGGSDCLIYLAAKPNIGEGFLVNVTGGDNNSNTQWVKQGLQWVKQEEPPSSVDLNDPGLLINIL